MYIITNTVVECTETDAYLTVARRAGKECTFANIALSCFCMPPCGVVCYVSIKLVPEACGTNKHTYVYEICGYKAISDIPYNTLLCN